MKDPKAVKLTTRTSGCPRTRIQLIKWFSGRETDTSWLEHLIEHGEYRNYPHLWNQILETGFSNSPRQNMWVTRAGNCWSTQFAGHARILKLMGLTERDAEEAGWLRLSGLPGDSTSAQCMFPLTEKQAVQLFAFEAKPTEGMREASYSKRKPKRIKNWK